jgi:hypothetical protein
MRTTKDPARIDGRAVVFALWLAAVALTALWGMP